ncbi:hypothetical protein SO802_027143 [Lithocarpus litseifolius]|uniref:Uncharacterized protein n=1 Tax=Lithocarpus litseifolius TaxID=425828 RepID=A0AAW2C384_9ROSI
MQEEGYNSRMESMIEPPELGVGGGGQLEEDDECVGGGCDGGGGDGGGGEGTGLLQGLLHAEHIVHAIWYLEVAVIVVAVAAVAGLDILRDMKRNIREIFTPRGGLVLVDWQVSTVVDRCIWRIGACQLVLVNQQVSTVVDRCLDRQVTVNREKSFRWGIEREFEITMNGEREFEINNKKEVNSGTTTLMEENESGRLHATLDGYNKPYCGPNKTKPKWTRVPQMDCGPSSVEEGEPRLTLGKRDTTQRGIEEMN